MASSKSFLNKFDMKIIYGIIAVLIIAFGFNDVLFMDSLILFYGLYLGNLSNQFIVWVFIHVLLISIDLLLIFIC